MLQQVWIRRYPMRGFKEIQRKGVDKTSGSVVKAKYSRTCGLPFKNPRVRHMALEIILWKRAKTSWHFKYIYIFGAYRNFITVLTYKRVCVNFYIEELYILYMFSIHA